VSTGWGILFVALWLTTIVVVVICLGLSRRLQGLEAKVNGAQHPEIAPDPGTIIDLEPLRAAAAGIGEAKTAVLFVGAGCPHCERLLGEIRNLSHDIVDLVGAPVVIVTNDVAAASGVGASQIVEDNGSIQMSFGVRATPVAVTIDREGRVLASGPISSPLVLREMIAAKSAGPDPEYAHAPLVVVKP
jgi:hypothetical protein